MNFYDHYAQLISNAINLVETAAIETDSASIIPAIGIVKYLIEYKTVGLKLPRAVGKTQYIIDHAQPWDLIVTRNQCMADYISKRTDLYGPKVVRLEAEMARGSRYADMPKYRRIWFDEIDTHVDKREQVFKVYDTYGINERQTFIFLST